MASTYLTRNFTSGDRQTFTISAWVKRSSVANPSQSVISAGSGGDKNYLHFESGNLKFESYDGAFNFQLLTNRVFRDTSAWYHIVVAYDSTQATASNRIKMYINGVQETSFATANYPTQNYNSVFNTSGYTNFISKESDNNNYFDGSMAHFNYIDGTAYDADTFGEADATTGQWKIKTSPSVTYGTNGFFILKDGNSVTDQSGNSNNFTVGGGTLTKTEDCPDNVFATGNPLDNGAGKNPVFLNGNNSYSIGSADWKYAISTLGMSAGKYYMEQKTGSGDTQLAGATDQYDNLQNNQAYAGSTSLSVGYYTNGQKFIGATSSSYGNTYTDGDIIGTAIDLDNGKIYFSKNGTWQNSGDPTSGSTGTGAISLPTSSNSIGTWFFVPSLNNGTLDVNYGNGYFGTTAVSSAGTNASGIGIFEYDVPTGYTALSTKGLNL